MKGLYLYTGIDLTDKSSGISNKILKQINIMKESGLDMSVVGLDNHSGQNFIENIKFIFPFALINVFLGLLQEQQLLLHQYFHYHNYQDLQSFDFL